MDEPTNDLLKKWNLGHYIQRFEGKLIMYIGYENMRAPVLLNFICRQPPSYLLIVFVFI